MTLEAAQATPDRVRRMAAMLVEGRTLREIAKAFGVSHERVRQQIILAGWPEGFDRSVLGCARRIVGAG